MSLVSKITRFATSPQGRRAVEQARTRLDTPENRRRMNDVIGKVRGGRTTSQGPQTPPSNQP